MKSFYMVLLAFCLLLILCLTFLPLLLVAMDIDKEIVMNIESSGNPMAFNKKSGAMGLYQITPIVVREWNNFHPKETYSLNNLYNPEINTKIAHWYLDERIPQMLKHYGAEVNLDNVLTSYNAGIAYAIKQKGYETLPEETQKYIKKYKEWKKPSRR